MTEPVSEQCLFCAIGAGEIAASVVKDYEDVMVFRDVSPQAPVHLLVIPKAHHPNLDEVLRADPHLGAKLLSAACRAANSEGLESSGYRLVANTGSDGGQTVAHAHVHVLGGRAMAWPPG